MRKVFRAPLMLLGGVVIALVLGSTSGVAIAAPAPAATSAGSAQRVCSTPSRGHMACMAYRRVDVKHPAGVQRAAATPSGYSPADLASAYNLPTGTAGAGETVAISIAFDNPHLESDLAVYRQQYGLPPCTTANGCFRKIDQRGGTDYPIADEQWGGESDLDVDMVSATCPQCHIVVVEADDNTEANLFAAIDQAVASGAQFVSNSWGGPEDPAAAQQLDAHFQHPGVAFTVSSGDFGFALEYPAFSQYVTAVGGTSLYRSSDARGFTESAWAGAGAGCADQEPKPSFQHDPLCPHRMEADVSAVADPQTGVAVYDNGWQVYGGTSVAAPLIAGVYALAGPASADQPANSYPYENPSALNDVTSGSDGYCPGVDYFCTAGPGYDGPTGLGTPDGITAFRHGAHGQVTGTIRDASTGAAVPGAKVSIAGADAITDDQGAYALSVPLGPSPVTVGKFGYDTATSSVEIGTDGQHVTLDLSLTPRPRVTVSGTLTDGSGHGWPLYGSVQVAGQPTTRVFTDPSTGAYRMSLPAGDTYTLQADPAYGGYVAASRDITVGATDQSVDLSAGIDATACDAPGYAVHIEPALDEHFDGTGLPTGWTRNDFTGGPLTWAFDDPTGLGNRTGGSGGFAAIDGSTGNGGYQGSALTSPPLDLTGITHPVLTMRTAHDAGDGGSTAQVFVNSNGQSTQAWYSSSDDQGALSLDLSSVAGHSDVTVQLVYTDFGSGWWQADDITVGDRTCVPVPGGLVYGHVTDKNTGAGVRTATVAGPGGSTNVLTTQGDPAQNALYALFVPSGTAQAVTASAPGGYQPVSRNVSVVANALANADFALPAGHLTATPAEVAATVKLGAQTTSTFTVRNTGTAPATINLHSAPSDTEPATGAPRITGAKVSPVQSRKTFRAAHRASRPTPPRSRRPGRHRPTIRSRSATAPRRPPPTARSTPWAARRPSRATDCSARAGRSTRPPGRGPRCPTCRTSATRRAPRSCSASSTSSAGWTRTATRSPRWTSTTRPPRSGRQARRCRSRSARPASRWWAARSTSSADATTSRSAVSTRCRSTTRPRTRGAPPRTTRSTPRGCPAAASASACTAQAVPTWRAASRPVTATTRPPMRGRRSPGCRRRCGVRPPLRRAAGCSCPAA